MLRRASLFYGAAAVCGLSACRSWFEQGLPQGAVEMTPPAVYTRWWRLTEACSGRSRDMASVRWYRTPGQTFRTGDQSVVGARVGSRIIIAEGELYDGPVVRHEILHALIETEGHPRSQFLGSCSSLVVCASNCVHDAGPWKAPSNFELTSPDSLEVTVEAEVTSEAANDESWLLLWVNARNRRDRAIVVSSPGDPQAPETFGYQVWGHFGGSVGAIQAGLVALDSSKLFLAPRETKRWLFEFRRANSLSEYTAPVGLPPGVYLVRGSYARNWSIMDTVSFRGPR